MSYRREPRASKSGLFDGYNNIEEGGLRASSSYSSDLSEHENDKALDSLKDRAFFLKQLSGDIHDEVLSHNRLLDRMGNEMDTSRGILSGTLDRFKMVFEKKSRRGMCKLVGFLVAFFLLFYYLVRVFEVGGDVLWVSFGQMERWVLVARSSSAAVDLSAFCVSLS